MPKRSEIPPILKIQQMPRITPPPNNINSMFGNIHQDTPLPENINSMLSKDAEIQKSNVFMTNKNKKGDFLKEKKQEFEEKEEDYKEESEEIINANDDIILEETPSFVNKEMKTPNIDIPNFQDRAITEIVRQVKEENKNIADFDLVSLIDNVLINLRIPHNEEMIDKSAFSNKNRLKNRLQRKRDFIRQYGKVIAEILDLSKNSTQTEIGIKYGLSLRTIVRLVKCLEMKFEFDSKVRFSHSKKEVRRKVSEGQRDWSFLDYDDTGNRLSREDILQKLVEYLLNNFIIIDNSAPSFEEINNNDPYFINAYRNRGFKLHEIIDASHLKRQYKNWNINEEYSDSKYTTLELIEDLKREIGIQLSNYISHERLSEVLGQKRSHIKSILEYCNQDKDYLLTKDLLKKYRANLHAKFKDFAAIELLIDTYENSNDLLEKRQMIDKYHPNLDLNFFKVINTKEKAYWFGLLYAEGSVSKRISKTGNFNLSLTLELLIQALKIS